MAILKPSVKKIAILYSGGPGLAGIENYLIDLFKNINPDLFSLELISLGDWPLTERLKLLGYPVKIFSSKRLNPLLVHQIGSYCRFNGVDLLVSQGTVSNFYARLISRRFRIKNLVTVHSDFKFDYSSKLLVVFYGLLDRLTRKATSHYIVVSGYLKRCLAESGISPRKISVVYNGADFPKALARQHKRLMIGSLGRLHQVKGYDLLIRAFALVDNKRLRLRIAGEGDELADLKALAKALGVESRVEFVGFKTDVYKFLNSLDIYVQTSRCEGFGLSLIQAMSQALPVVVTPAGSLKELVADKQTGYTSKDLSPQAIADALSLAVSDIKGSIKVGQQASRFVNQNFIVSKWIEKTEDVYNKVIK